MTQTVASATAQRAAGPIAILWAEGNREKFRAVLPASVDLEAFLGTASGALYADEKLMQAAANDMDSLLAAMMECAALGHLPGTDDYYLTPRGKKGGGLRILGIEGYKGVIERMYRSGAVANVVVREVCAKDKFRFIDGVDARPVHFFGGGSNGPASTGADFFGAHGTRDRGEMVGAYAYASLLAGATSRVVLLSRHDWEAARAVGGWTPDDKFNPWNRMDGGDERPEFRGRSMVWKTCVKRLEPWVPTSAEYRREEQRAAAGAARLPGRDQAVLHNAGREALGDGEDVHEAEIVPDEPKALNGGEQVQRSVPATSGQRAVIGRQLSRLGYTDAEDAERTRVVGMLARPRRPDLTDVRQLTQDEAQDVAAALKGCGNKDDVTALLDSGEKPGGEG